jgi:hypothetical protein
MALTVNLEERMKRQEMEKKNAMNSNFYADSPSRRRSSRVASLSPSSFTPLIQEAPSGTLSNASTTSSSSSTTSSSFLPSSPSRKYSVMRGLPKTMDEINLNEIEASSSSSAFTKNSFQPNNNNNNNNNTSNTSNNSISNQKYSQSLRSNPDRKHPTLNFQPTNLSTPSTSVTSRSGITPSIKQINLQETPSQAILEKLVSQKEMDEIAKSTPLRNFYKNTIGKILGNSGQDHPVTNNNKNNPTDSTAGNNNHKPAYNIKQTSNNGYSITQSTANTSSTKLMPTYSTNNNNNSNNNSNTTPKKQINVNTPISDSDETVKVVHNLRNRSIIASPLPAPRHHRRSSLAAQNRFEMRESFEPVEIVSVFVRRHQKNLLAYALATLFLLAASYHIYDGITRESFTINKPEKIEPLELVETVNKKDQTSSLVELTQLIDTRLTEFRQTEISQLEKIERSLQAEIRQIKAVDSSKTALFKDSLKSLEGHFKVLENKMEKFSSDLLQLKISHNKQQQKSEHKTEHINEKKIVKEQEEKSLVDLTFNAKVIKHLTTSPTSFNSVPENVLSSHNSRNSFIFKGNRGKITLQFPSSISATRVSIEKSLNDPFGCAPKDFEIWSLRNAQNERDRPVLIGKGTFDALRNEPQEFPVHSHKTFILQMRIRNNHGNDRFTCLYRFKVL